MQNNTLNISSSTLFRFVLIVILFTFCFYIFDILLIIFGAFVIASAISPLVDKLEKYKIPRFIGTVFLVLCIFFGIGYFISLIFPPLVYQARQLAISLPAFWENFKSSPLFSHFYELEVRGGENIFDFIKNAIPEPSIIFSKASSFFRGVIYGVIVFSLTFYMTLEKDFLKNFIKLFFPKEHLPYVISLVSRIQCKMGYWLQGQLFLNLIVGFLSYLILYFLGVPYALLLAILAFLLEFIPSIGPTLVTVLAALIALSISPIKAIVVIICFIVMQQIENQLIIPWVMKQAVGLNPIIIVLSLLIGIKIAGPIGAILAVPFAAAISEFTKDLLTDCQDGKIIEGDMNNNNNNLKISERRKLKKVEI